MFQGSINTRINILYFVDSLIDQSIESNAKDLPYLGLLAREVKELVRNVVPDTRDGILNYKSTKQVRLVSLSDRMRECSGIYSIRLPSR
jgi:CTD kinase subunit gamma